MNDTIGAVDGARTVYASSAAGDDALGAPLVTRLRMRLLAVWFDRNPDRDGKALDEQALRRLRRDRAFVLLLGPGALASSHVRLEIDAYRELLAQEPDRLLLVARLASCPVPPDLEGNPLVDVVGLGVEAAAVEMARLIYGAPPVGAHTPPLRHATVDELGFERVVRDGCELLLPPVCAVPEGEFVMGSDASRDEWARPNESPPHRLRLDAFAIGAYPITVAEYALAVDAGAVDPPRSSGGVTWEKQLARPTHPAVIVSWAAAHAYAAWLAERTGEPWRLPTEAEWEKAARGSDGRRYPWGDAWDPTRANTSDGGPDDTTPVGAYGARGASPCGALDMAGNVWEWCGTLARPYPYDANDGRESPTATGNRHARRIIHQRRAARVAARPTECAGDPARRLAAELVERRRECRLPARAGHVIARSSRLIVLQCGPQPHRVSSAGRSPSREGLSSPGWLLLHRPAIAVWIVEEDEGVPGSARPILRDTILEMLD